MMTASGLARGFQWISYHYNAFLLASNQLEKTLDLGGPVHVKVGFILIDEMIRAVTQSEGDALAKLHATISFSSKFAFDNQDLCVFLTFLTTELKADVDLAPP